MFYEEAIRVCLFHLPDSGVRHGLHTRCHLQFLGHDRTSNHAHVTGLGANRSRWLS